MVLYKLSTTSTLAYLLAVGTYAIVTDVTTTNATIHQDDGSNQLVQRSASPSGYASTAVSHYADPTPSDDVDPYTPRPVGRINCFPNPENNVTVEGISSSITDFCQDVFGPGGKASTSPQIEQTKLFPWYDGDKHLDYNVTLGVSWETTPGVPNINSTGCRDTFIGLALVCPKWKMPWRTYVSIWTPCNCSFC